MMRIFAVALASILLAEISLGQLPPDQALASMRTGDGLQVELFAHEPMLLNPTAVDIDHKGRVWVTEAVNYRRKNFGRPILREEGDRIQILIDESGAGKASKSLTFYQGKDLIAPLSVLVLPQPDGKSLRVLVAQSPDILEFWDRDGDLKADGPPTKFLTGFGGFDHDHGVHGLTIGPDGKLYFTVGDSGVKDLKSKDGKGKAWTSNTTDCQKGTVWRCDLDGKNLELIAHNFRNNYEACVDSFGEIWLSDNDDDGNQQTRICFVMPGGNYGYGPRGPGQSHWHEEQPGIVHKVLRTGFGSPTGICFYEGTLLPEQYRGDLIHADAGPREIRYFKRKPKGAGYELEKINMLTSTDNWFRPSDVCVAPDGSVFVADWYDPGVGGHGMGDWTRGRIYRLTPNGHKGYKVPEVKLDSKQSFLAAFASPCLSIRTLAFTTVFEEETRADQLMPDLQDLADPILRARVLTLANRLMTDPKSKWNGIIAIVTANDPDHRLQNLGVRMFRDLDARQPSDKSFSKMEFLLNLAQNQKGFARELALWLQTWPAADAAQLFFPLARLYDGQDIFYRAALNIACGTDPARRDAILADFEKQFPEWNDKVADLVWELRPKSMLPKLEKLMSDSNLTAAQKARIVDILAASDDNSAGQALLALLTADQPTEVKTRAIENLRLFLPTKWNSLAKSNDLKGTIKTLLGDIKTTSAGLQLVAAANETASIGTIGDLISRRDLPESVRVEAVRTLGLLPHPKAVELLDVTIVKGQPAAVQKEAVRAMANQITGRAESTLAKKALASLQSLMTGQAVSEDLKRAALDGLAGTRAGTGFLLQLKEKNQFPSELVAEAGRLLRNSPFQGERNKAMMLFPVAVKLDPKNLPAISVLAKRKGSAESGKLLLAKSLTGETQCLKCHTVRGIGGQIGPDLSAIGKKASRENLIESILVPSKAIADQYVSWKIETTDGQSITGLMVQESPMKVTLRDANGKDYVIPTSEIESKSKSLISLMPEGLVSTLTEQELLDIVEYMMTLQDGEPAKK